MDVLIKPKNILWQIYWVVAGLLLAGATAMVLLWTPIETTMGPIQKVFYVHLPTAICAFLACATVFVASLGYLWQRRMVWDDLASAAASVAVVLCTVVLLTGMIWGRFAWGQWWTWSPRLTFSLLLWLLYVVYVILRPWMENRQQRATISAVYGLVAFLDVPLAYLSVRLMPDIHPSSVQMDVRMQLTLAVWFVPVALISIAAIQACFRRNRLRTLAAEQTID